MLGRDRVVGIATGYGLDGPGINSQWGEILAPVLTGPGTHPAFCTMGTRLSLIAHLTSSAEVKERVELYRYSPSGPSWAILGRTSYFIAFV